MPPARRHAAKVIHIRVIVIVVAVPRVVIVDGCGAS